MGLDMYLKRTILVPGWKPEDYDTADDCVSQEVFKKPEGPAVTVIDSSKGTVEQYDPPLGTLEKARMLAPLEIRAAVRVCGDSFQWFSIFEEVGYWRKENAIHLWFVENVQGGVDECQLAKVTKEQLIQLREACAKALCGDAERVLPTRGGFFFGSTDYDEWYQMGLYDTIEITNKVIRETDWEKQTVFYRSSW